MIDSNKLLEIPEDEKNFIDPRLRPKFFMNIIKEYEKRCPNLKLIYAYLNTDANSPIDFIVLFQTKNLDKTLDLIVYDIPLLYSDRSIPGYRYCMRTNKLDDYFKESTNLMVSLQLPKFNEFINSNLVNLSVKPDNEMYWRKQEFSSKVAKSLLDLSLRYVKR